MFLPIVPEETVLVIAADISLPKKEELSQKSRDWTGNVIPRREISADGREPWKEKRLDAGSERITEKLDLTF